MKKRTPVTSSASNRRGDLGGSRLLSGMLIGFCCSSAAFLAISPVILKPARSPPIIIEKKVVEEKIVYAGVTVVPPGSSRPVKKLYTERIEPVLAVVSSEKRLMAMGTPAIRPKVRLARSNDSCKPGRTRNAQGQCGRWTVPNRPAIVYVEDDSR